MINSNNRIAVLSCHTENGAYPFLTQFAQANLLLPASQAHSSSYVMDVLGKDVPVVYAVSKLSSTPETVAQFRAHLLPNETISSLGSDGINTKLTAQSIAKICLWAKNNHFDAVVWKERAALATPQQTPKIPMGMNLPSNNYYTNCLIFRDVMKTASPWLTYNTTGESPWDTENLKHIPLDPQGYPLELPYKISASIPPQSVKFLINNHYKGRYVFLYDGIGEFAFHVPHEKKNGQVIITLNGSGDNSWIDIVKSTKGNHVRNIRILPENEPQDSSVFVPKFLEGLKGFHCIRFMDWMNTNFSPQKEWSTRSHVNDYSQGLEKGIAVEYAITLCNTLQTDAWFCVPHQADDDYITRFALLVRDQLNPKLKVYLEYSNEVWNWTFNQSQYILNNAPQANNSYVSTALQRINHKPADHPEKDAYMMQRTFKMWSDVYGEKNKHRLVRVAAVQHAWVDNTRRILQYLFKKDQHGKPVTDKIYETSLGAGCDAVSPGGYFCYSDEDVKRWESAPSNVTAQSILTAAETGYWKNSGQYTAETAKYAKAWKVDYVVYEGGQHINPPQSRDWSFNPAIWDAQIHPKMYDLYMKLFAQQASPDVDCKLFCAFSYVSLRKSKWGSWGSLESLDQLDNPGQLKKEAPKFKAIIDANKDPIKR